MQVETHKKRQHQRGNKKKDIGSQKDIEISVLHLAEHDLPRQCIVIMQETVSLKSSTNTGCFFSSPRKTQGTRRRILFQGP
jgi:hypothetical protein